MFIISWGRRLQFRQIRCLRRWRSKPHLIVIIIGYPYKRYPTRWFFNCNNIFVSKLLWYRIRSLLLCQFLVLNWVKPLEYGEKEFFKTTSLDWSFKVKRKKTSARLGASTCFRLIWLGSRFGLIWNTFTYWHFYCRRSEITLYVMVSHRSGHLRGYWRSRVMKVNV